jgi:hypothetical protein
MAGYRQGRLHWTDFYPVEESLISGVSMDEGAVMLFPKEVPGCERGIGVAGSGGDDRSGGWLRGM